FFSAIRDNASELGLPRSIRARRRSSGSGTAQWVLIVPRSKRRSARPLLLEAEVVFPLSPAAGRGDALAVHAIELNAPSPAPQAPRRRGSRRRGHRRDPRPPGKQASASPWP